MRSAADAARARVLVVDDEPDLAHLLADVLTDAGHVALACTCALEAAMVAARFAPDVVLLDVHMPDVDGHTLGRELLATLPRRPRIIVLTGDCSPPLAARSLEAGFFAHRIKPMPIGELLAMIDAPSATPHESARRTS